MEVAGVFSSEGRVTSLVRRVMESTFDTEEDDDSERR
jgi:hypothetical protein